MATTERHPNRYPKHEGDKGQVFGGECNRTRCTEHGATWFNRGTRGYECEQHARGANSAPMHGVEPCVEVDHQISLEEMEVMAADVRKAMRA